jgi:hypothetical protein
MCLSALFSGQKNILTFLRRASSKSEVIKNKDFSIKIQLKIF